MNENIDLTKILKDCPKGWKFYSSVYGEVKFKTIELEQLLPISIPNKFIDSGSLFGEDPYPIKFIAQDVQHSVSKAGEHIKGKGECTFFPSKEQRDWSKFTAPWYKKDNLVNPKFKVGDWIISSVLGIAHIIGVNDSNEFQFEYIDGKQEFSSIDYVNYAYDKWTIEDAKDGDMLFTSSTASHETFIFKSIDEKGNAECYFAYDSEDGFREGKYHFIGRATNCKPATKEQRDLLFQKMKEAGYEWDAEKKELKKLVPNRFDPNTLRPFDKVLVRDTYSQDWTCGFFSHIVVFDNVCKYNVGEILYKMCIPYNDDTKHLVGTKEEAPEYYRYWEE